MPIERSSATARSSAEVGVVVGVAAELGRIGEEPDLAQAGDELLVELRPLGQLGERVARGPPR